MFGNTEESEAIPVCYQLSFRMFQNRSVETSINKLGRKFVNVLLTVHSR